MKAKLIDALETEATEQLKEIQKLRETHNAETFKEYMQRAKVACVVIGSYVKLRGTQANEETNRLVAKRLDHELPPAPKQLKA